MEIIKKIIRLIKWIPVIWNDRDWDYLYLINIMTFKLSQMEKYFIKSEILIDKDKHFITQRIKTLKKFLNKVYDEEYEAEFLEILDKKYGKYNIISDTHTNSKGEKIKVDKDERTKLFLKSQEKQRRAEDLVWRLFNHSLRHFWD